MALVNTAALQHFNLTSTTVLCRVILPAQASGAHPVFLTRMDSHMALVNTAALQLAGLLHAPDAAGSGCGCSCGGDAAADAAGVDKDPVTGRPTGLLRWAL